MIFILLSTLRIIISVFFVQNIKTLIFEYLDMADDNNKRVSTVATVAVAAGLGFGAYKLFQALTKNSESESNQEDQQCENRWTNLASSEHRESSVVRNPFRNQEIRIINTILECNKAMRELKSYVQLYFQLHIAFVIIFAKIFKHF